MSFNREGLIFRPPRTKELGLLLDKRNDPEACAGRRDPRPVMSVKAQIRWLESLDEGNLAYLALDDDIPIGLLRISNFDWEHRSVGLTGCDVFVGHERQGYGTRIMRAGAGWLIDDLGFHRITAQALDTNVAAQRIIEKAGFHIEGVWRQYLWRGGEWHDFIQYSILDEEWTKWKDTSTSSEPTAESVESS